MYQTNRTTALLSYEVAHIQDYLDGFYPGPSGRRRRAWVGSTGEFVVIEAMPLPDGYHPDEIDLLLLVDNFPSIPPIGIYMLNRGNEHLVRQLKNRFNAFQNNAYHDAPAIKNYTWLCYAYANNHWRYNASDPRQGDNLRKFLSSFFAEAQL